MGVPYIPVRGLAASDVFERRDDMMVVPNPFDPEEETVVALAQRPDVALIHASKADREGSALVSRNGDALLIAQASHKVIVTAEEIVDRLRGDEPGGQFIPAINVTAVVEAPRGAHPTGMPGHYEMDAAHIREYVAAAVDDDSFHGYLDRYVLGASEQQYQERVGVPAAAPAPAAV